MGLACIYSESVQSLKMLDHGNWQKGDSLDVFWKSDVNLHCLQFIIFAATEPTQIKFPECKYSRIRLGYMLKGI